MNRIEINKKYKGYFYIVYACSVGHRCGYVKVPKGHFLYRKNYNHNLGKFSIKKDFKNEPVGKRNPIDILCASLSDHPTIGLLFNVHGGITYSDWGKNLSDIDKIYPKDWLIGFDCAHSGDGKDTTIMDKDYKEMEEKYHFHDYGTVRTKEYVERECKNLIEQIIKYFDKENQ